jgi:hypothetical protein
VVGASGERAQASLGQTVVSWRPARAAIGTLEDTASFEAGKDRSGAAGYEGQAGHLPSVRAAADVILAPRGGWHAKQNEHDGN